MEPNETPRPKKLQWDTEERHELISKKEGHIRETTMYLTAPLWRQMQDTWGGVVTHVKTATDLETGEAQGPAPEDEEGSAEG
jgi:hypothetical protein